MDHVAYSGQKGKKRIAAPGRHASLGRQYPRQIQMNTQIEKACAFISSAETLPTLEEVARHVGMSPTHFQKSFVRALGISPRAYADAGRQERLRQLLREGEPISGALYEAGFGSPSRVYEFAARYLGMTPKDYQQGGRAALVLFTVVPCPLGQLLVAATHKGLCSVRIGDDEDTLIRELETEFHSADLRPATDELKAWTQSLVDYIAGTAPWPLLPYDIKATAFQRKVWEWLRTIPPGETMTYGEAAEALGMPNAARAVARACATNPVALVIPCHRIVPKAGGVGGYRWAPDRKKQLLAVEEGV